MLGASVLLLLVALFSVLSDRFLSVQTLASVANQIPDLTVIAVGMTFVLIIGGSFGVLRATGALDALIASVLRRFGHRPGWLIFGGVTLGAQAGQSEHMIGVHGRLPPCPGGNLRDRHCISFGPSLDRRCRVLGDAIAVGPAVRKRQRSGGVEIGPRGHHTVHPAGSTTAAVS